MPLNLPDPDWITWATQISVLAVAARGLFGVATDIISMARKLFGGVRCSLSVIPLPGLSTIEGDREIFSGAINVRVDNGSEEPLRVGVAHLQARRMLGLRWFDINSAKAMPNGLCWIQPHDHWSADFKSDDLDGMAAKIAWEIREKVQTGSVFIRAILTDGVNKRHRGKKIKFSPSLWLEGEKRNMANSF